LVLYDLLGLNPDFRPRFVQRFAELGEATVAALRDYGAAVREGRFPTTAQSYDDPVDPAAAAAAVLQ
jgi:3-methyl-2-oxobutanoate hydroxymethyltransferase